MSINIVVRLKRRQGCWHKLNRWESRGLMDFFIDMRNKRYLDATIVGKIWECILWCNNLSVLPGSSSFGRASAKVENRVGQNNRPTDNTDYSIKNNEIDLFKPFDSL